MHLLPISALMHETDLFIAWGIIYIHTHKHGYTFTFKECLMNMQHVNVHPPSPPTLFLLQCPDFTTPLLADQLMAARNLLSEILTNESF